MQTLDWVMIGGYFALLFGVVWWVVSKSRDTAADYFLAGRNLSWWIVGASIFASNIGSEHVVGLAGSGAKDGVAMAHYELHAWCLLVLAWVFVPFYARSLVFTMPEFLERRFSTGSRYVLSIVSLITFVVSKIAVGIFAGGVVFSALLPDLQIKLGETFIDSFWIGSVAVIVLTGLYTVLGGMRAVAYNDAVQTVVLICGSATLTVYGLMTLGDGSLGQGWSELRHYCGSDMFNLWKPLIPPGVEATWEPVKEPTRMAWYFNNNFPWLGMAICAPVIGLWYWCTDQYIVQRALGAPDERTARRGSIFAAFLKLFPVYLFIIPGLICFALAKSGKVPALAVVAQGGDAGRNAAQSGVSPHGHVSAARRVAGNRRRGSAVGADGLAGRGVQCLFDALHGGPLREDAAGGHAAPDRPHRADRHRGYGSHRAGVDSRRQRREQPVRVLAEHPGLPGAADFRGLFLRRVLQAAQRERLFVGDGRRLYRRRLSHVGRHACDAGFGSFPNPCGLHARQVSLDRQQHQLSVFQHPDYDHLRDHDGRRQPGDAPPSETQIRSLTFGTETDEDKRKTRASWSWQEVLASCVVLAAILGAYLYFRG